MILWYTVLALKIHRDMQIDMQKRTYYVASARHENDCNRQRAEVLRVSLACYVEILRAVKWKRTHSATAPDPELVVLGLLCGGLRQQSVGSAV